MSPQPGGYTASQDVPLLRTTAGQLVQNPTFSKLNTTGSSVIPNRSDVAATLTVDTLEYTWTTQHHSTSSYPDCWSQPIKLVTEFCQTEDYKSRFAARVSTSSSEDVRSCFRGTSIDHIVQSKLPASMELKCSAPHLHRWNPSMSADFTDYFHDRIKVLSTGGTLYRYCSQLCALSTDSSLMLTPSMGYCFQLVGLPVNKINRKIISCCS